MGKGVFLLFFLLALGLLTIIFFAGGERGSVPDSLSTFVLDKYINARDFPDLQNHPLYVQFITPANVDGLSLFSRVVDNWHASDLKIIALTEDGARVENRIGLPKPVNVLHLKINQGDKNNGLFLRSSAFFIYGKHQELFKSGISSQGYDDFVKICLKEIVDRDPFRIGDFIPSAETLLRIHNFPALSSGLPIEGERYHLVALFNELCSSCKTGQLIQYLNGLCSDAAMPRIEVFSILNSAYNSESDKSALVSQSHIAFTIYLSDPDLTDKWQFYIQKYNRRLLSDILILIDGEGRIAKVLDTACNCDAEFFGFINELLSKGELEKEPW